MQPGAHSLWMAFWRPHPVLEAGMCSQRLYSQPQSLKIYCQLWGPKSFPLSGKLGSTKNPWDHVFQTCSIQFKKTVWSMQALAWQECFTETGNSFGGMMANCLLFRPSLVPLNKMNGCSFIPLRVTAPKRTVQQPEVPEVFIHDPYKSKLMFILSILTMHLGSIP